MNKIRFGIIQAKYPFRFCGKTTVNKRKYKVIWTYPLHLYKEIQDNPGLMENDAFNRNNAIIMSEYGWGMAQQNASANYLPVPAGHIVTRYRLDETDYTVKLETVWKHKDGAETVLYATTFENNNNGVNMDIILDGHKEPLHSFFLEDKT